MSDLISRQEAIDMCRKPHMRNADCSDFEMEIMMLPSVQPKPQWIPCSERLPEDFADVLVWFEYFRYGNYNRMYATHGIGNYLSEFDAWTVNHESGWHKLRVIAWMPLPEPYEEERQ